MFSEDPSPTIEAVFRRIHVERMADLPLLNPALRVEAVGFERRGDRGEEWRGVLVTPWCIDLLLLPAVEDWPIPATHDRAFRQYAAGQFAFLPNHEEGLGNYLVCPLIHDMKPYVDHETAVMTARACLFALDLAPLPSAPEPDAPRSPARRKFLLRKTTG